MTKAGAWFSIGARQDPAVRRAIASIDDQAWVRIEYSQAILDPDTGELVSAAEVAEIPYTAFTSHRTPIAGRLIVRRVPERNTRQARRRQSGGPVPGLAVSRDLHQRTPPRWSKPSPSTAATPSSSRSSPT